MISSDKPIRLIAQSFTTFCCDSFKVDHFKLSMAAIEYGTL